MNVNKATIVGRVTRDPEVRSTTGGQSVTSFSLAVNNFWTDKSGVKQERTEFINVVLWGRLAEIAGQWLAKGQECYVEGRIQSRKYTDKQGIERTAFEIVGESMQLGQRANGSHGAPGASQHDATSQPAPAQDVPTINLDDECEEIKIEDGPF